MLRSYCNFAFHQQMAILSYSVIYLSLNNLLYLLTLWSYNSLPPPPLSCISFIPYSNMSAIYPSYLTPHSLFKSLQLCTHSPSHYFPSPSCRSSLGFGGSLNTFGPDALIGHYDLTYPEQLLTHTYPSVQSVQLYGSDMYLFWARALFFFWFIILWSLLVSHYTAHS
jgi:hypothetical protein